MKIFDFTNGTKGRLIGEVQRVDWCDGLIEMQDKNGQEAYLTPKNPMMFGKDSVLRVRSAAGRGKQSYTPEQFGVEAILFCEGQFTAGETTEWSWSVVGTEEWVVKAYRNGFFVIN